MNKKNQSVYRLCAIAVFAALCFASNYLSFPIPVSIGPISRIHLGNIFCLLSGLLLGPVGGGLSAGIGCALYDVMTPAFVLSAPFTLVFKFVLAALCGLVAHGRQQQAKNVKRNIAGAVCGSLAYIVLYLGKTFVEGLLAGSVPEAMVLPLLTKLTTSAVNAVIGVVGSVALYAALSSALEKSGLKDKLMW